MGKGVSGGAGGLLLLLRGGGCGDKKGVLCRLGGVGCPAASRPLLCALWEEQEQKEMTAMSFSLGLLPEGGAGAAPTHPGAGLPCASGERREEQGGTKQEGGVGNGRGGSAGRAYGAGG